MKPLKAAAVIAGSLAAVGAAAPAHAASAPAPAPVTTLVDGALDTVHGQKLLDAQLMNRQALGKQKDGSALAPVQNAAQQLKKDDPAKRLLGGLPIV